MARMKRTVRTRVSRPHRKFIWARTFVSIPVVDLATEEHIDALAEVQTAIGADLIGCTVVRTRGEILAVNADATAGTTAVMGMRVFTTSTLGSIAAGSAPVSDEYADWMLWEPFVMTASGNAEYGAHRKTIDVKSARKLEEVGQSVLLSFQGSSVSDVQFIGWLSLGVKLP